MLSSARGRLAYLRLRQPGEPASRGQRPRLGFDLTSTYRQIVTQRVTHAGQGCHDGGLRLLSLIATMRIGTEHPDVPLCSG
jgi:hypothetical protein